MFIKRLEIFGFKSFKKKTVLEFDNQDITGVVGPNGCGKSNIVDALLWVMGENSPKHLRGESLSDIIFGGTNKETPSGLAEVKLTLGKGKREFPEEYKKFSEIMITRKAYRDGKNECFINDQSCLLRDIREIFMNTGAGCRGFSIIEQESIEKLITAKPIQRRFIIEEVAGITKFKNRKNESARKLDLVNQNLKRLDDILKIQEAQLSQLASQAKKAEKYRKLKQEIETRQKQIYISAYQRLITEQESVKLKIEKKEQNQKNKEKELEQKAEEIQTIESQIENVRKQIAKIEKDITEKKMTGVSLTDKRKTFEMIQQLTDKKNQVIEKKSALKEKELSLKKELADFKDSFKGELTFQNIEQTMLKVKEYLNTATQNKKSLTDNIDLLKAQIQFVEKEIEHLSMEEKDFQEKIKENINQKSQLISLLKKEKQNQFLFNEELNKLTDIENQMLEKKSLLDEELGDLKSAIPVLAHTIEEMKKLISQFDNINPGADDLTKWKPEEFSSLSHNLKIDPEYTTALTSILGPYIHAIIPKEPGSIEIGIERLKTIKTGKTSFLSSLPSLTTEETSKQKIKTYPAFICFLSEKVKWNLHNSLLKSFLEQTVVVSNLKAGFELKKQFPLFQFVTLDGDYITRDSIVHAGSEDTKTSLLQIRDQIENNSKELSNKQIEFKAKEIQWENCLEQLKNTQEQKQGIQRKLTDNSKAINSAQQNTEFIEKDNLRLSELREKNHRKQKGFKTKKENLLQHQSAYNQDINKWDDNLSVKNSCLKALERALDNLKDQKNLEQEETLLLNIINQFKSSTQTLSSSDLEREVIKNQEQQQKLENQKAQIQNQLKSDEQNTEVNKQNIKNLEQEIFQIKLDTNSLQSEKDKKEIEKTHLKNKFLESYQLQIEDCELESAEAALEQLKEEMLSFEQQLERIKEVNFLALEEYEKLSKENFFLNEQKEDLVNSKKEILKVISHIDKICKTRFNDMLEEINKRFSKVFPIVFQGDNAKAELILHEDTETKETGVDILIHPPGKRPQSVSLLSRGEKALTSICLIYSLFLVKPSPFCIIDEADAPLDDANIFRFLSVLKEMAQKSQIIAVTHNKYTMQSCRKLYGITQEQPGISQIVSVDTKSASQFSEQSI